MAKLRLSKKATEAVLASIDHWEENVLKPLRAGKNILLKENKYGNRSLHWARTKEEVKCYSADCPLCILVNPTSWLGCTKCPYTRKHNKPCMADAWGKFYDKHTLKNCEAMMAKLKAILE